MQTILAAFIGAPGPFELLIIGLILAVMVVPVVVVLILVSKNRGGRPRDAGLSCPDCGARLSETDENCPSCGRVIM
ncbi:MAG: hypothetical protein ACE5KM_12165 [Planctomycetaceae bacterium]